MADIGKPVRKIRIEPEPRPQPEPRRVEPRQPEKDPPSPRRRGRAVQSKRAAPTLRYSHQVAAAPTAASGVHTRCLLKT